MKINFVIADSQILIVEGLKALLKADNRFNLAGICNNTHDLFTLLESMPTNLLITDFAMEDYGGFDPLKKIKDQYPQLSVLILTNQISRIELNELTKIGIKNIIHKNTDGDELFAAIDSTLKKKKYYSGEILDLMLEGNAGKITPEVTYQLTNAELEIVKAIATGLTTKEIALQKNVSFHTVMSHRKNIFRKLGIGNAPELLMYAVRAGIIDTIEYHI
jgi:DNA-binding NarL/FixJ family response regulator